MAEVQAQISYLNRSDLYLREKPFIASVPFLVADGPNSNIDETKHEVSIHDVRGSEKNFTLPVYGFQYIQHEFVAKPEKSVDGPAHPFIGEVVRLLKDLLKPKEVVVYDCNVRRIGNLDFFQPATSVHIDHSARNAQFRFQEALEPYKDLKFGRWQAYTVWCPLDHPVTDWPLAVCDSRTVDAEEDLESVDTVLPHRVNEIYHLRRNPKHQWYYLSGQRPDEPLIMKIYDSETNESRFCPHASFRDVTGAVGPPRNSIDVRAFVVY